ncbi:phytoene/squalene synthase family protein [Alteriqipengyuania lutimaris]|uniref:Phytoene/squalene synthase family protein n=1 Tax=Alteriqipengyuania lutimaris TaxID=1538146 RepID=A0A395LH55_9SPHN|nr:phytoene/squalene synthase family protein [Alteriqipengyuania lutimaris]MBB3034924.1 phytoene synthase [Alteriqipengyuania lutimaris]RDS76248.1 phytoene/squalene synthase family protein [Alteriqipengyuania lutimaris]
MTQTRPLVPSRFVRPSIPRAGGGRDRAGLVRESYAMIADGSRSFALASKLFDRPTRERVWMLYAWCRRCDDLADAQDLGGELGDQAGIEDRLQAIKVLTRRALEGGATADPAFDALGQVAGEAGITLDMVNEVISGFAMDANGFSPTTEKELMRYCYHVAGAVGVLMARVMFAPNDSFIYDRACDLGLSFQLANISRDVIEDARAGRCYLPEDWLADAGLSRENYADEENRFALAGVVARLVHRMKQYEDAARLGAKHLRFRQRWAVLSAARIYGAIGQKVLERGQYAWNRRVYVPFHEKLWHVGGAFFEAVTRRAPEPVEWPPYKREDLRPVAGW